MVNILTLSHHAPDTSIFKVAAVMKTNGVAWTVDKSPLRSITGQLVQPDDTSVAINESCGQSNRSCAVERQESIMHLQEIISVAKYKLQKRKDMQQSI